MRAATQRRTLSLELDGRSDPIAGNIREEDGPSRAFEGWLGLAAVLGSFLAERATGQGATPLRRSSAAMDEEARA